MTAWECWKARAADAETAVRALYLALRDPRTPLAAKALLVLLLGYVLSPIHPIPDIVPNRRDLDEVAVGQLAV